MSCRKRIGKAGANAILSLFAVGCCAIIGEALDPYQQRSPATNTIVGAAVLGAMVAVKWAAAEAGSEEE